MSLSTVPTAADAGLPGDLVETVGMAVHASGDGTAFLNAAGFASALCDADGVIRLADERFTQWAMAGEGAQLDRLPPMRGGRVSLLCAPDGRTVAAAVASPASAGAWPLAEALKLRTGPGLYPVIICTPLAAIDPARSAFAQALGLTGLEARIVGGLMRSGDLRVAAKQGGVTYETARAATKAAMRKAGVHRQGALIGLCVTLQSGEPAEREALLPVLGELFGISARQAEIALLVAQGSSRDEAAEAIGASEHVIKAELKSVFTAMQVATVAALAIRISEVSILSRMVSATSMETVPAGAVEPLRLIPRIGRAGRIAVVDHGPRDAMPVLILHTATTSRHNPASFIRTLQAGGLRPIALDRPGFGLSGMVSGDYLAESAQDLADILDTLGLERACILARGGTMVLARFAERWSERIERAVVVNPEPPPDADRKRGGLLGAIKGLVYGQPWLTGRLASYLSRNASAAIVERLVTRSLEASEADLAVLRDPEICAAYVRASQHSALQGGAGFRAVATTEPFASVPAIGDGRMITIVCGAQDPLYSAADSLPRLQAAWPGCSVVIVPDGGRLVHFQKPELIARLLGDGDAQFRLRNGCGAA
ncbi:alpha/beta hydrolase [Sphingomonas sp. AOB5]|nr:alpha/beta hydrolase [Sphingomonas sp. AOB5]